MSAGGALWAPRLALINCKLYNISKYICLTITELLHVTRHVCFLTHGNAKKWKSLDRAFGEDIHGSYGLM